MTRLFFLSSLMLLLIACGSSEEAVNDKWITVIEGLQTHFAPDRRVARFDVEVSASAPLTISGETNLAAAKDSLGRYLAEQGVDWKDEIIVWPTADIGAQQWGIVQHSVANLRSKKGHSQELATQALLGTPLKVFKKEDDWYLVQTPDGYISWLDSGGLALCTKAELEDWKKADRHLFTADFGFSYVAPDRSSPYVGDLVAGAILVRDSVLGEFTSVRYPDGRQAYVLTPSLRSFAEYQQESSLSFDAVQRVAQQMTGRPYLWGGTSPKGMDCSGFTKTVYWLNGHIIPRDASQQVHAGTDIPLDDSLAALDAGDFLFFGRYREDGSEKITHVGIYLGEGAFIHSGADNGAIRTENLLPETDDYAPHRRASLLRARRFRSQENGIQKVSRHPWYF